MTSSKDWCNGNSDAHERNRSADGAGCVCRQPPIRWAQKYPERLLRVSLESTGPILDLDSGCEGILFPSLVAPDFRLPELPEVLRMGVNYPQAPLGLSDLVALALELLLVREALLRPGPGRVR
jgi:hypothetical protein